MVCHRAFRPVQPLGDLRVAQALGQVAFEAGRWRLVRTFAGLDIERAAALLRDAGWRVTPPTD